MAMKAMKAAKPQNKDDQKANPMKAMKKPLKAKKQPTKTTKLKEADGAMVAEVMKALRWVQENESTIIAQMHESWVPEIDGEWAKIITQNVPDVFLNFWKEGKDMKYKWYLCNWKSSFGHRLRSHFGSSSSLGMLSSQQSVWCVDGHKPSSSIQHGRIAALGCDPALHCLA